MIYKIIAGIIVIAILFITFLILEYIFRKNYEKREKLSNQLKRIKTKSYNNILEIGEGIEKLNNLVNENPPRITKQVSPQINETKTVLSKKKKQIEIKESEAQKERKRREREHQERIENIQNLIEYFDEKGSSETIPNWAINCSEKIIEEAQDYHSKIVEERTRQEKMWEKATNFVLEHKAYPSNFRKMEEIEREMYLQAMILSREGKLEEEAEKQKTETQKIQEDEAPEEDKELLRQKIHHTNELDPEQKEKLIEKYGYRHKATLHRDGSRGNNLIIRHDGKSESDYHFCMKHLFAEIDLANAKVEHAIGELRADVAFIYPEGKIAVEIETGKNKEEQVKDKANWLNKNFDYWIFVCSRENKKIYKQYVDNKKSFCLTLKEADEKVQELTEEF